MYHELILLVTEFQKKSLQKNYHLASVNMMSQKLAIIFKFSRRKSK